MNLTRSPSPATVASHLTSLIKRNNSGHVCDYKTCQIENLTIHIHEYNGQFCIVCKYFKPPPWYQKSKRVDTIYNIYVCKNTGKIHHCHAHCDGGRITNDDNCQVCLISGVQYESEVVRSWQISSRCVPTLIQDKRDPHMFNRDESGRVHHSGIHNIKLTQCVMVSNQILKRLLFSLTRKQAERHKIREYRKESEKCVNKYKRYCDKQGKPKVYVHALTLYIYTMKKKPIFTRLLNKTKEQQLELVNRFTKDLICYWKMFIQKTCQGNAPMSFKIFVPACLYTMRTGLVMGGVEIIHKSRYLESALPEANGLHMYDINKPSLTHGQNHIYKSICNTVEKKIHTPRQLRDYYLEQCNKLSI